MSSPAILNARPWMAGPGFPNEDKVSPWKAVLRQLEGGRQMTERATPPPNPLPQGEGELKAGRRDALDSVFDVLWTYLPVWLRRASQDEVDQPRVDAGEAWMPKPF